MKADLRVTDLFKAVFGAPPAAVGRAPASVTLLGDLCDHHEGYVLTTPLPYFATVSVGPGARPGMLEGHSSRFGAALCPISARDEGGWLDSVAGCVAVLRQRGARLESLRVSVDSDLPVGAGLASSAALRVALLRALDQWLGLDLKDEDIARLARRAEASSVAWRRDTLDPVASALGKPGQAILLDARDLTGVLVPLPSGCAIAVTHSGVHAVRSDRGYAARRAECLAAAAALGVPSLGDVGLKRSAAIDELPDPLNRRARHVVTENNRALEGAAALRSGDLPALGTLMVESYCSQRDDCEISGPAVDALVEAALRNGALGARLTGGGFRGAVVALLSQHTVWEWWPRVARDCPNAGLVFPSLAGAGSSRRAG